MMSDADLADAFYSRAIAEKLREAEVAGATTVAVDTRQLGAILKTLEERGRILGPFAELAATLSSSTADDELVPVRIAAGDLREAESLRRMPSLKDVYWDAIPHDD